jgi:antirestriction protein ArdC
MASKVYEIVAERILHALDKGVVPWRSSWKVSDTMPRNAASGKPYRGVNIMVLWATQRAEGYAHSLWMTFNQAKQMGGSVRKGEKGTPVIFWGRNEKDDGESYVFARYYTVFNIEQIEGVSVVTPEATAPISPIEAAESIVTSYFNLPNAPLLKVGPGLEPAYRTRLDHIEMPPISSFTTREEYYSSLFHEMAHSTGHATRLDRDMTGNFKTETYAHEELTAEMTAAFLSAEAQIDNCVIENQAAYIAEWRARLKKDPQMLIKAAQRAQKAADYILRREFNSQETVAEESATVA